MKRQQIQTKQQRLYPVTFKVNTLLFWRAKDLGASFGQLTFHPTSCCLIFFKASCWFSRRTLSICDETFFSALHLVMFPWPPLQRPLSRPSIPPPPQIFLFLQQVLRPQRGFFFCWLVAATVRVPHSSSFSQLNPHETDQRSKNIYFRWPDQNKTNQ